MLELDFSPWEDGPPIQDDCSQAEGLAYSEAVRQLQEKSQRGLSKELVKRWGAHFKDKSCERCVSRRTQCVWRVDTAGCQPCQVSKLRCSKVERYASRLIAARLGLQDAVSWARFQKWGKIRRPGGGRKSSVSERTSPKVAKPPRLDKGKPTRHSTDGRRSRSPPVLRDRSPSSTPASLLLKRSSQVDVSGRSVKRPRTHSDETWEMRGSSSGRKERELSREEEEEDEDSDAEGPDRLKKGLGGRSESTNVSFQIPPSPLSFSASPSLPPASPPPMLGLPLPEPRQNFTHEANHPQIAQATMSMGNLLSFGPPPAATTSQPPPDPLVGDHPPSQIDGTSGTPLRYPSPSTTPFPPLRLDDSQAQGDPSTQQELSRCTPSYNPQTGIMISGWDRKRRRPQTYTQRTGVMVSRSDRQSSGEEPESTTQRASQRERTELRGQVLGQREDVQEQIHQQREALERNFTKHTSILNARLEESESERAQLQAEVEKAHALVGQERRSSLEHASELADFRQAYSVLLHGATEAGYALRAGARYRTNTAESPSHEAFAQSVLQDAIIRAMDIVLRHQRDPGRAVPAYYSQGSDGYRPMLQDSIESVRQGSSSQPRRDPVIEPQESQEIPPRGQSVVQGLLQQSKSTRQPAPLGSPQSCSSSLHPRMRRLGILGRDDSLCEG